MARTLALAAFAVLSLHAERSTATTTLQVDLSATIRPVTHAASGSLYGITEKVPADLNALVAPLRPSVFNNPAADVQQPVGDAIVVAGRVATLGARVSIRLADLFPSWPYHFTTMSDWLDKLSQTVSRKAASGVDNYYGYEIWNEPNGTWTSQMPFNDFWQQSYAKLRELDPTAKIIGPSISFYDANYLRSFLTFAKANACLPDIVGWHELSGGNLTSNFQNYRKLEQDLGIGPLPISINEYSGKNDLSDEGMPGASAPMIAKFERFGIDSACISYWDVAHPGRLGSLLATDTSPNAGWWFYKWYGDMRGDMVTTTPPAANDATALDGFANVDSSGGTASVLFAGVNDGAITIAVTGFHAATFFGSKVHAVVERAHWVNRTTPLSAGETLSTADVTIANDQVTIAVAQANATDGYRLTLTPLGGAAGGSGGNGGGAAGGRGGAGGAGTRGGAAGTTSNAGGTLNDGGGGGSPVAAGGAGANAGLGGAGAVTAGGAGAENGGAFGGMNQAGGTTSAAGHGGLPGGSGASDAAGSGQTAAGTSSGNADTRSGSGTSSGCSCSVERTAPSRSPALFALVMSALVASLRRRARLTTRANTRRTQRALRPTNA
jgi:MYXO-CTERM domain-containing protein